MKKGFAPILVLVAVVIAAIVVVVRFFTLPIHVDDFGVMNFGEKLNNKSSPTPDPTADWKMYTSSDRIISHSYPSNWKLAEATLSNENSLPGSGQFGGKRLGMWSLEKEKPDIENGKIQFNVSYETNDKNKTIEQMLECNLNEYGCKTVKLQNQEYTSNNHSSDGKVDTANYIAIRNSKIVYIQTVTTNASEEEYKTINQILSTFVFTGTDKSFRWVDYSNKDFNFSISYPEGWRISEQANFTGFGPKEITEDTIIVVSFNYLTDETRGQIIDAQGKQFSDRKQSQEEININGVKAIKLTTTTDSLTDWYLETIIIESKGKIYTIGNGAIKDENQFFNRGVPRDFTFKDFYSTFKFTK